ncbi:ATP-binding protein, partial [Patescibacteria group bacterium]
YLFSAESLKSEIYSHLTTVTEDKAEWVNVYLNRKKEDVSILAHSPLVRQSLNEQLIHDTQNAKESIKNRAELVAREAENYIKQHPEMTIEDLQNDPAFQEIAVQSVGETGYTALTDYKTLTCRFHSNPKIVDLDLHNLAEKLPGFWSIMEMTEGGRSVGGFYDWQEADGSLKKKYMYIEVIDAKTADNVGLTVAATTYLDEYDLDMELLKDVEDYFNNFSEFYNYSDLFLVSSSGDVWWSAQQDAELGTNLDNGIFQETLLAETYKAAQESKDIAYSDYAFYPPSYEPKAFIASPVYTWNNNIFVGIVVLQVGIEEINEMIDAIFSEDESGNAYLVGGDYLMRTDIKGEEGTALKRKIETVNSQNCFTEDIFEHEDHEEVIQFKNHQNIDVVGAHIYIPEKEWCLLAEIEVEEALASINNALWVGVIIGLAIVCIVFVVARWISKSISEPILKLHEGTKIVEKGNLDLKIDVGTKDEIGALGKAFNKMTSAIKKSRAEVERKVEEQTKEIVEHKSRLENQQRAVLNILEDVAEEKEITAKERDKINTILYSIGDGVFVVDKEYKVKMFNKMAYQISGYTEEEVFDKPYNEVLKFISEKDKSNADTFIKEAMKTGKQQSLVKDSVLIRKDGSSVPVSDSAAPLKDNEGNVIGCIVVFRDVTKEREVEQMKSEFVSIASHQLRTPLTVMGWELEMMGKGFFGKFTEKQLVEFKKLDKSHKHMLELVNDLLDASRIDAGRLELKFENIQLDDIIKEAANNVSGLAKKKKIKLTSPRLSKKSPFVNVDSSKISEVIQNLIENAVKYTPDGGKVDVSYKPDKDKKSVVFCVTDNGIGIPLKDQKRMFTKFFRADNAVRAKKTGTGLGLYIAKTIVENSSGGIWFETKEGKGTRFYIRLPIINKKNK